MKIHSPYKPLIMCLILSGCGFSPAPSNVKINTQPAHGVTESSFDHGYLQQLIDEVRASAEQSLQQAYDRNNIPQQDRNSKPQISGRYEWMGKHQLAVIDLSYSANPMRVIKIVGVEGEQLISISCISPIGDVIDLRDDSGECSNAIKKEFHLTATKPSYD
jgi:hypothetical protein